MFGAIRRHINKPMPREDTPMAEIDHNNPGPSKTNVSPKMLTPGEIQSMLNDIAWYFKRTNSLEVEPRLVAKLNMTLREICDSYTN